MKTQYPVRLSPETLLRRALLGNSVFTTLSSIVILLAAWRLTTLLGIQSPEILQVIGVVLLPYGAALWYFSRRPAIPAQVGWIAAVLDTAWVIGSAILLIGGWVPFTVTGQWAVIIMAVLVAVFAALQYFGAWRTRIESQPPSTPIKMRPEIH